MLVGLVLVMERMKMLAMRDLMGRTGQVGVPVYGLVYDNNEQAPYPSQSIQRMVAEIVLCFVQLCVVDVSVGPVSSCLDSVELSQP